MHFVQDFIVAWIGGTLIQGTMNHKSFSEEYYVAEGRVKEVNAWISAQVCPGLATPLDKRCV